MSTSESQPTTQEVPTPSSPDATARSLESVSELPFDRDQQRQFVKVFSVYTVVIQSVSVAVGGNRWLLAGLCVGHLVGNVVTSQFLYRVTDRVALAIEMVRNLVLPVIVSFMLAIAGPASPMWGLTVLSLLAVSLVNHKWYTKALLLVWNVVLPTATMLWLQAPLAWVIVVGVILGSLAILCVGIGAYVLRNALRLRRMVVELTDEVAQRRAAEQHALALSSDLEHARSVAVDASLAKSEFLANMSHEIRTPMNAIVGMSSLLMDTELSGEQRSFVNTIRESGDSLLALISDILDYSKIEARQLELEQIPVSLPACLESLLDLVGHHASDKGLELYYQLDADVPHTVMSDPTRLRQILLNLVSNAIKFTDAGEIAIRVCARALNGAGDRDGQTDAAGRCELHISVVDTGIGISEERLPYLFTSFVQAERSTTREYGGTGLGLAICKRLVELMDGQLTVKSKVDAGSEFSFAIPVALLSSDGEAEHFRRDPPALVDKRVLHARIGDGHFAALRTRLQQWGMEITNADSIAEATTVIETGVELSAVVVELWPPRQESIATAARIADLASTLPVIVSAPASWALSQDPLAGRVALVPRPVKADVLYQALLGAAPSAGRDNLAPGGAPANSSLDRNLGQKMPLRILLAEDHAINRKLAVVMLSRLGYAPAVVEDGAKALAAVEQGFYDVVLMDVQMPNMNGLDATRRIRAEIPESRQPRIIAVTANASQKHRKACLQAGMDDYISKPFRPQELIAVLERVYMRGRAPSAQSDHAAISRTALDQLGVLLGTDARSKVPRLISEFLADSGTIVSSLKEAADRGQAGAMRENARALVSLARTFGALPLADIAAELEQEDSADEAEWRTALVERANRQYLQTQRELRAYVSTFSMRGESE